ncbi:Glycine dehydrogenase, glycine cleavage system P protein [Nitrospira sp. KM1]|uniref:aminomethyl-transferring glycine dehydrogenase n=1 Tax=Nitrospira sp. KM1 TaxID=1936990 RepID=UPI0013A719A1|nr:aminomethyl-transferring glycine dehydrogenase [Nitrospira sp. KM1]BCA55437.1 Glycine dehydrogenase, glycine cleavage system P protein [Nitrospira sp. KM1]
MAIPEFMNSTDSFINRHLGVTDADQREMLAILGAQSLQALSDATIPADIQLKRELDLPPHRSEQTVLHDLQALAAENRVYRSLIGMGYYQCVTPAVIQRNILENPGWYTQYTPYQAEIAQGRLEALVNFQTMVAELTGLPLANSSLLDEATAAAEAMAMCLSVARSLGQERTEFFISQDCHPQTVGVMQTRAEPLGLTVHVGRTAAIDFGNPKLSGIMLQYPATDGYVGDYSSLVSRAHEAGVIVVVATDLLALTLLRPPGEFGADIAIGSSQRFGVPLGFGGPHAAFIACKEEYKRQLPGRIVGVSKDKTGRRAYRLSLQTREQHIRREKATSNICTAQVLLAIMASMYAIYHGPEGLQRIARRIHGLAMVLAAGLRQLGFEIRNEVFFDTLRVTLTKYQADQVLVRADEQGMNLRRFGDDSIGVALDEVSSEKEVRSILEVFVGHNRLPFALSDLAETGQQTFTEGVARTSPYLTHEVFNRYHAEHEMLRYLHRLQSRDLSLTHSMIPLGSCTMKLNATTEMLPITWPEFSRLHPFAPVEQTKGYLELFRQLEGWLAEITGFAAVSLQPNAGSQGEYAGLMVIRAFHRNHGEFHRDICLIPVSAHGTNPASAAMVGMTVVPVACDKQGNVDLIDLEAKAAQHRERLAALMLTYPSTHGVFEPGVRRICQIVHTHGGQVYMDGANMNAQVGLCRPGDIGADVCHLNLHKTFCIPHGGGGPGMGPIAVARHLAPFLPGHPVAGSSNQDAIGPVSAAPYGSPSILTIPWVYIALMGRDGLTKATQVAILNANYMAKRLEKHYSILYTGAQGFVAHEFILDLREFKDSAGIEVMDVAKRLMDYGFHAPTVSFPVAGTLMIEPTESESKAELDRFCEAMILIRAEIQDVIDNRQPRAGNLLKNAPHTAETATATQWDRPYTREQAVYPAPWVKDRKFWPHVGRIDEAFGDRNLMCTCPPMDTYQ